MPFKMNDFNTQTSYVLYFDFRPEEEKVKKKAENGEGQFSFHNFLYFICLSVQTFVQYLKNEKSTK